jgi:hypothetical protein
MKRYLILHERHPLSAVAFLNGFSVAKMIMQSLRAARCWVRERDNNRGFRALAHAANSRTTANAVMLNAKSAVFRLTGVGAMCALIGLRVGAASFGYSYVHDPRTSVQKMAQAFAEALEKTTLTLDPHPAAKLAPNGAQVKISAGALVPVWAEGSDL